MKIMLVDDSSTMRRIQKNTLGRIGYDTIIEAGDGQEALDLLATHTDVKLVLMDWNMPNMDGLTALKAIKGSDSFKTIPVIMVTSESSKDKIMEAIGAGASSYVVKPFEPRVIEDKITKVMEINNLTN